MSEVKFYRLRNLARGAKGEGLLPVSGATIWRWVKDGNFPKPIRMGNRCTAWKKSDIDEWMERGFGSSNT